MKTFIFWSIISVFLCAVSTTSMASWAPNGNPVSRGPGNQFVTVSVSDGAGGAIFAWQDGRTGLNYDIYAQHLDSQGNALWAADGIPVCAYNGDQEDVEIVSDGSGGAIVVWQDGRSGVDYNIFAQRLDADGNHLWTAGGVLVCGAVNHQQHVMAVSDGYGGAVIAWEDIRLIDPYIFAQRIDPSGTTLWTSDGELVSNAIIIQWQSKIATDGAAGAIITFVYDDTFSFEVAAQRIASIGVVQWGSAGISISAGAPGTQDWPTIISDGTGGAIIAWNDSRNFATFDVDIYAQRVNSIGSTLWPLGGAEVCNATGTQSYPKLATDGSGGAIVAWWDNRNGDSDLYAQRMGADGISHWVSSGVPVCIATEGQVSSVILPDGYGGAYLVWETGYDIYAQRIDPYGGFLWPCPGAILSGDASLQRYPYITQADQGGIIAVWQDDRYGTDDAYAQYLDPNGDWGYPAPLIHSVSDIPGDQGGLVNVAWDASDYEGIGYISYYSVWRAIDTPAAVHAAHGDSEIQKGLERVDPVSGMPEVRLMELNGEEYYWRMAGYTEAFFLNRYSLEVATLFDSTSVCDDYHYFQVIAHTVEPSLFWTSQPDSGYSVDNLAPCPPLSLAGELSHTLGGLNITWAPNSEIDLDCYNIYRGTTEDFVPGPGTLLGAPCDTLYFDGGHQWDHYYKVSAIDVHGNESGYSLLRPVDITGDDTPEVPLAYYLDQNVPNPFNPNTNIRFGIKEPAYVSLRIYDAAGRLVTTLIDESRSAGQYEAAWNGTGDAGGAVTSGVYFYRLVAGDFVQTKKMVLIR